MRVAVSVDGVSVHAAVMKACFIILLLITMTGTYATAAPGPVSGTTWMKTYPSCGSCEGHAIAPASDGGYLVTGVSLRGSAGRELLVVKTDASGNELWKTSGSGGSCEGNAIAPAGVGRAVIAGGGCIIGAGSASFVTIDDLKGTTGQVWDLDAGRHATGTAMLHTGDGGFLLLTDADTDASGRTDRDVLIHRINADGTIAWSRAFSSQYNDTAASALQETDGSFVIAMTSGSTGESGDDIVLLKLDPSGEEQWLATIGHNDDERAVSIVPNANSGYLVLGTVCHRDLRNDCDMYAAGTDLNGKILWEKRYGGSGREYAAAAFPAPGGGFIIAGSTDSPELGAEGRDIHIVQIDSSGTEVWNSTFGSPAYEYVTGATLAPDGSLIMTGYMTEPVDTGLHTLFVLNAGTGGRNPPADLLKKGNTATGGSRMTVSVRDTATGAGIAGAQVYVDGKLAGTTSADEGAFTYEWAEAKKHSFRIAKDGYREKTVTAEKSADITVLLQPSAIHRLFGEGLPEQSLDIVFVPSGTSYDCTNKQVVPATKYIGSPDAFLADVRRLVANRLFSLEKYSAAAGQIPADYKDRLSISYYWNGYRYADAFSGCAGRLPDGFYDEAPYTDVAIILYPEYKGSDTTGTCEPVGCTSSPGPGPQVYFKVAADRGAIFLHETGHAMFGLMDTYCGNTYYEENQPSANIWVSKENCRNDAQNYGWNASLCRAIAGGSPKVSLCGEGLTKYDLDPDLMGGTGITAKFGDASTRRIRYVLDMIRG